MVREPVARVQPAAVAVEARRSGRPVLGAIVGLLFGLFVGLDLVLFNVVPFNSALVYVFPVAGLLLGLALGLTSPIRRRT